MLLISRISLLALVYLVFLRVARAVVVEIRAENNPSPAKAAVKSVAPSRSKPAPVGAAAAPAGGTPSTTEFASPRHRLEIRAPKSAAGRVFELVGETTIGRATGCAVSIDDSRVSKIHARVFADANRWIIEDLGSTNGTLVNGDRIDMPWALGPGDVVQVGDVIMEFV